MNPGMLHGWRVKALIGLVLVAVFGVLLVPAIPQPVSYHHFVDNREFFGIPNFWNVATNLPFFVVGLLGVGLVSVGSLPGGLRELRWAYLMFFVGTALVGIGSGYYHLDPSNKTLFWDRLPMTVAFTAFFCMIIGEYVSVSVGRRLLWPLVSVGACSVIYWSYTESLGRGDLRAYGLVQFLPVVLTLFILVTYRSAFGSSRYIWAIVATYAAAKLAEALDVQVYALLPGFSGHSLKHVIASAAGVVLFLALLRRKPEITDD